MKHKTKSEWPHACNCGKEVQENEAIGIGRDKNGHPVEWYNCPTCGNTFTKVKEGAMI